MIELDDDLLDYLADVRGDYLTRFRDAITQALARTPEVGIEGVVRATGESPPYRFDVIERGADGTPQTSMVTPASTRPWKEARYPLEGGAALVVGELVWFAIVVAGQPAPEDFTFLDDWYRRWLTEGFEVDKPFGGYPHFLGDVEQGGTRFRVGIDLGSSPVEALRQLVEAFTAAGVTTLRIYSERDALSGNLR